MTTDQLKAALQLPAGCQVGKRVPKKLLVENGAPTAADKRRINEGVEDLYWVATLKPTTVGVPAFRDDVREYLEIAVMSASLRDEADATRVVELIHRAIPYPVLLLTEQSERRMRPELSATHKRWSQSETGMTVLDGDVVAAEWDDERWPRAGDAFALSKQPRASLYVLYQGWIDALLALQAAHVTGTFRLAASAAHAALRRSALKDLVLLDAEATGLRANAAKQKQMSRRVELNQELKRVEAALAAARANL
ncbi:DUF4391 domain-containing protein [Gemmatimonas sp.]|uniref:DUF4391 domain-containing protein n=1 Tax=Gemmatimonas sp. TaxID=1962908 RepID=UPI00286EA6F0|nr:DUF4391 domain-containing protein [Gemmatimonas sp.]